MAEIKTDEVVSYLDALYYTYEHDDRGTHLKILASLLEYLDLSNGPRCRLAKQMLEYVVLHRVGTEQEQRLVGRNVLNMVREMEAYYAF